MPKQQEKLVAVQEKPLTATPNPASNEAHYKKIYQAHPDADSIYNSSHFQEWIARSPLHIETLNSGNTQEVIALFSTYKDYKFRNIPSLNVKNKPRR